MIDLHSIGSIPAGHCQCGCGQITRTTDRNDASRGLVRGRPRPFVKGHNMHGARHHSWNNGRKKQGDGYMRILATGHPRAHSDYVLEHILIAERALGKPLPPGAEVHHVNGRKDDNRPTNLVLCDSRAYHRLLHVRQRSLEACGNPNWRKCSYCKQYDDPTNMRISNGGSNHKSRLQCRPYRGHRMAAEEGSALRLQDLT